MLNICRFGGGKMSKMPINDGGTDNNALHQLISEQKWDGILRLFSQTSKKSRRRSSEVDHGNTYTTDNNLILHHACQFNAPLWIINLLSKKFASSIHSVDDSGRYPIHIAVANGCEAEVILYLIEANPTFAGIPDKTLSTPLHYGARDYARRYEEIHKDSSRAEIDYKTLAVVQLLTHAAATSLNVEDVEGMNPIEHALLNGLNIMIIEKMHRAAGKDWKSKKTTLHYTFSEHNCVGAATA